MEEQLGTLHMVNGRPVLRFERHLAHPPEKVWKAVTDPAEMAHWFPAYIETKLKTGARMRFSFGDDNLDAGGAYADGEILEYDPPKVYAFRWIDDALRFELIPERAGCRLVFTYALNDTGTRNDLPSVARTGPGWDVCLGAMTARLDGRDAPQPDGAWVLDRAERYVEEFGLAEGEVRDIGDGYVVRFERDLIQPVDQVWATFIEDAEPITAQVPPLRFTHGYLSPGAVTTSTHRTYWSMAGNTWGRQPVASASSSTTRSLSAAGLW